MRLMTVDPRALEPNPDPMRRTPATPQADALLLATIKAVGIGVGRGRDHARRGGAGRFLPRRVEAWRPLVFHLSDAADCAFTGPPLVI